MAPLARRCQRVQAPATTLRFMSTNPDVDDNAFVHSISKEQAKKALERPREIDGDEANRKRVIYRSKQRGWLEVDLLLGSWASQNVMQLTAEELQQYEDILNEETIDIFNYISGKSVIPERLDTPMMQRLQDYCLSSPLGKASTEGFAKNKKYMSN
ncbi:hypothetical protein BBJ28_00003776 [Nothophytophthora sp. Chile5]|nr:hypothetical protein BBJ28_00003776 [Nothophytophthora sp. Chile5]